MRIESFIGLRFLRAKRHDRAISAITWISMVGVMLGVTALIITISVMNGFRENLFIAVSGNTPHIRVLAGEGAMAAGERAALLARLGTRDDVLAGGPYLSRQAFMAVGDEFRAVLLRGIDPRLEAKLTELSRFISPAGLPADSAPAGSAPADSAPAGSAPADSAPADSAPAGSVAGGSVAGGSGLAGRDSATAAILESLAWPPPAGQRAGILLGAPLARSLALLPGDELRIISPVQRMTPIGPVPLMKQFLLVGTFDTGLTGQDELLAYVDFRVAQKLFRLGGATDGLGLRMRDPEDMDVAGLRAALPGMRIVPWMEENKNIFQVMRLEKLGLFLILALIIVVSFFNIISSLVMLVLEKRKAIAILKTMGARDGTVRSIFFMQGIWIGTVGTFGGLGLGLAVCWVLATFDLINFPAGVFPLTTRLPMRVDLADLLIITAASFAICMLVTLYPASRAARVKPVDNLRYE